MRRFVRHLGVFSLASALTLPVIAGATGAAGAANTSTVNVVGYSTVATAFAQLETAFQQTKAGAHVNFTNSFGASTTQAQDVLAGQPADIVNFSYLPDLELLTAAGLVAKNWNSNPTAKGESGYVTTGIVVFLVRKGNPLGITNWSNLISSGAKIVTPDPISSGSARWNLLAAYESTLEAGGTPAQATTYVNKLIADVVAEPSSGSKALSTFLAGTGDVLLAYESDAKAAVAAGDAVQIVNPPQDVAIENPLALTTSGSSNKAAVDFYKFLFSPTGQGLWWRNYFRPTLPIIRSEVKSAFFQPTKIVTPEQLGGWDELQNTLFSPTGVIMTAEKAHGYNA